VTASTLHKDRLYREAEELAHLEELLLTLAIEFEWQLEAWAVFQNHYHFVGRSPEGGSNLNKFCGKLHGQASRYINGRHGTPGRQVWYSYRQVCLTYERSYLARLNYVHNNAVHHGLVRQARDYPYCSADWFFQRADPAWFQTVFSFPIDRLNTEDDF
jgi:putative transposase